jgi:regulator of protease activity HflC (stomatin/prohibitin superfamily)
VSPVLILAILTTGLLFFLMLRRTNTAFTMVVGAISLLMWLLVIVGWMTNRAGQQFHLSLPDPGVVLFALICSGVALYAGAMGGEKSLKMTAIATGAIWLAIVVGWIAGGWNGILAVTMPSLLLLAGGLLALPAFVLPVEPLPWKRPVTLALVYTGAWLLSSWAGWLRLDVVRMLVYGQGLLLILRPAIPIESVKPGVANGLFAVYAVVVFLAWRLLGAFFLNQALDLIILVQSILVLTVYALPLDKANRGRVWMLGLAFGVIYVITLVQGSIPFTLTNLLIPVLGFMAFFRFALPDKEDAEGSIVYLGPAMVMVVYLLVWFTGLVEGSLDLSWFNLVAVGIGSAAILLPLYVHPSDNWKALKALITYNLGRNYPYYALVGRADEVGRLAKRADGNRHASVLAGPGITLSNADHAFVLWEGTGSVPERVVPPGLSFTNRAEDVQEAVDLRPQLRVDAPVEVKTRDGINIEVPVFSPFRLAVDRAIALNADGRRAIVAQQDGSLQIWSLRRWRIEGVLSGHRDWVRAVALTPDGSLAISVSSDETLRVWNVARRRAVVVHEREEFARVRAVAITFDGRRSILGFSDGALKVLNLETGLDEHVWSGHEDWISAVSLVSSPPHAVSASADGTLKVWNLQADRALHTLAEEQTWVDALAVSPDGHQVVAALIDGSLKVWSTMGGGQEGALKGCQSGVRALTVAPNGQTVFCLTSDGARAEWDLQTGSLRHTQQGPSNWQAAVGAPGPELGSPFPFDEEAVKKAVRAQRIEEGQKNQKSGWDTLVAPVSRAVLRDIVAGYTLDELFGPLDGLGPQPRVEIARGVQGQTRGMIKKWGLQLLGAAIGNLEPPEPVIEQRIAHWQAHLRSEIEILEAQSEAKSRTKIRKKQAEAERKTVAKIGEMLSELKDMDAEQLHKLVTLSLLASFDHSADDPKSAIDDSGDQENPASNV